MYLSKQALNHIHVQVGQCQSHQFYNSSKIKKLDMSLNIEKEVGDVQTDV